MSKLFDQIAWAVYDCISGASVRMDKESYALGSGEGVDLDFGDDEPGVDAELKLLKGFGVSLSKKRPGIDLLVNGESVNYTELALGEDYSIKLGSHFLALRGGKNVDNWLSRLNHAQWFLLDSQTEARDGPMPAPDLCRVARENRRHPRSIVRPQGMRAGFHLQQLWDELGQDGHGAGKLDEFEISDALPIDEDDGGTVFIDPTANVITPIILNEHDPLAEPTAPVAEAPTEELPKATLIEPPPIPEPEPEEIHVTWEDLKRDAPAPLVDQGPLQCPACWLRFDAGDILHVAVHESLRGDPILGTTAHRRFLPTRFNDDGLAVDEFGLPCPDLACPHCRRQLPGGFVDLSQHFVSIIGDVGSGKSYYLAALSQVLPESLQRHFEINFQDADPAANETLNARRRALANATDPAEARLKKTEPDGATYEKLSRYGRIVPLPRPFVFRVSSSKDAFKPISLTLFDNAGGDFLPGADTPESPGAQHVAHARGLLFLFDPFSNSAFRKRLNNDDDPQSEQKPLDRQEVILTETLLRIQRHLKLPPDRKPDTPMAVVVGKHDAWSNAFSLGDLKPEINNGRIDLKAIDENSDKLRALLRETCPNIVSAAESISRTVRFFAASSFGHTPVKIDADHIAPDPKRLSPESVDLPLIWLLAKMNSDLNL
jgi:hypothetical protein